MSGVPRGEGAPLRPEVLRAALVRAALLLVLWLAIAGLKPADLPIGIAAAVAAAWASLALLPPQGARMRLAAVPAFALDFLRVSFLSGLDVARRAFARPLDLRPGFVAAPLRLKPGFARDAFCAAASLMPGTLPTGADESGLIVHALDAAQPIAAELAAEETLFMRAIGYD